MFQTSWKTRSVNQLNRRAPWTDEIASLNATTFLSEVWLRDFRHRLERWTKMQAKF
ncbi:hypothetical protein RBSH_00176 [Rhodopirellula baltica SH28]|uniref:Uncharacterized protein n=2 Tax=Rhodopirellula baltica TaxID=265606 RepID=K5EF82_RHOBT|nr:hypothetical protein RBSH_00176 [Rhodopirellula baltica SH28]